jgi:predicted DNA-binding transcriptional regulator YafY
MERKAKADPAASPAVSLDRARRLIRLVQMLGAGSQGRAKLMRPLRLDVRGFYRDLQCLRAAGIEVTLQEGKYALEGNESDALSRVPFPDPGFSLGEAVALSKGRTGPHLKLKHLIASLMGEATVPTAAASKSKPKKTSKAPSGPSRR